MFTLVHGLYSEWTARKEFNILLLGPGGAGQTTLLEQLRRLYGVRRLAHVGGGGRDSPKDDGEIRTIPTIGFECERIDRGGSSLWNLKSPSGGVRFRAQLWHHYYPTMDGAIFMVDPNQLNASIDNFGFFVKGYIQTIQKEDFVNRNHTLPVLLLVNKQDSFGNADSVQDTIAIFKEGINPIISASSDFVTVFVRSCSALKRDGVKEAFELLCTIIQRKSM